jgi:hypothetical protein
MTLGVYAAAMDWADGERNRLRALVEGEIGQRESSTDPGTAPTSDGTAAAEADPTA